MNVLLIDRFFLPSAGGAEYVITLIAHTLAEKGHKVWVISNKFKGYEPPSHKNIKMVYLYPEKKYQGGFWNTAEKIQFIFSALKKGFSIIRKEDIKIIHTNPTYPAIVGAILSFFTLKPHIMIIHDVRALRSGALQEKLKRNKKSKLNSVISKLLTKFVLNLKCSAIHTVSDFTKDGLEKIDVKKSIYVIPNALVIKKESQEKINPLQFITISRLVPYKNIEVVLKAIQIIKKKFPKVKLIIVGDGPHKSSLQELVNKLDISNNITFAGYVTPEEKRKWLAESNALLFPSINEGFGMVILEGFQEKKPVLVSNLRPMSEIVKDQKTGFVIDPYDEKKWAEALEELLIEPNKATQMGRRGRIDLEENYSLEIMGERILKMYNDIIKN